MISISTVTPVYSGEDYLENLVNELEQFRSLVEKNTSRMCLAESVFVLDEAIDSSHQLLKELSKNRPWIRVISLSKNFGQHNATVAGILHCSGDWVVTLDEDMQHSPGSILQMLTKATDNNADVIFATGAKGSHGNSYRDWFSGLAKKMITWVSANKFTVSFSSFRLIRGQIARAAASVCSHQTYFDVALVWFTSRVFPIEMQLNDSRFIEKKSSGYSFGSLISHMKRLIISSDVQFFRASVFISGFSLLVAVVLEAWVLFNYFYNPEVPDTRGWSSLMSVILLYGGGISLLLGFILEFVRTSMFHGQGKPIFFIIDRSSDEELKTAVSEVLEATR